jgi:hypothetical protein
MKSVASIWLAATVLCSAAPAWCQASVDAHIGTAGVGPDLQYRLNDQFSVRGAADWLDLSASRTYDNVSYGGRLQLLTGGAFLDWHPWSNAFFVSGGSYFGDRKVSLSATPATSVTLGGRAFTPAQVGRLDGDIRLASTAPFAGLGVENNTAAAARGWGFKGLLGVAFGDKPSVSLTSSGGLLTGAALLQQALVQEQANIASKVGFLQYYPVAQAGLTYRF